MQASCDSGYKHMPGAYESRVRESLQQKVSKVCVFPLALVAHILSDVVDVTPAVWLKVNTRMA